MPILRVNLQDARLGLHQSPAPVLPALTHAAQRMTKGGGPVIIMVHGFKFEPGTGRDCPHEHIFAPHDAAYRTALSWPNAMGFGQGNPDEGLAIAFGWEAKGMIWDAYARAADAGRALARIIRTLRRAAPHRPVHAITHSLGARVVLQALPHLPAGDLGRIIALNPAEFRGAAAGALQTAAGRAAELITVASPENLGFDLMLEGLVTPVHRGDKALGLTLPDGPGRLLLRLDRRDVIAHLATLGFPVEARRRLMCHWSPYMRNGAMPLYAALLRHADTLPLTALCARPPAPRQVRHPLPWRHNAPS